MARTTPAAPQAPTVTVETITPEMATEWLGHNVHNRNVRQRVVEKYAEDMLYGAWELNGDSIRFTTTGELLDGQHRLLACVEAETPFTTVVVRGLPPAVMPTIDQGAKRLLADVLRLNGEVDVNNLGAAITLALRWDRGQLRSTNAPSINACLDWLQANPGIRDEVRRTTGLRAAPLHLPGRVTAAFALRAREDAAGDLDAFLDQLQSGAELHETDPIYAFRRWVFNAQDRNTNVPPTLYLALLIKTWNYWVAGVPVEGGLRLSSKEKFPTIGTETEGAAKNRAQRRRRRSK